MNWWKIADFRREKLSFKHWVLEIFYPAKTKHKIFRQIRTAKKKSTLRSASLIVSVSKNYTSSFHNANKSAGLSFEIWIYFYTLIQYAEENWLLKIKYVLFF